MELDLSKYVTAYNPWRGPNGVQLRGFRAGQIVAKDRDVKELAGQTVKVVVPYALKYVDNKFLSGLLRSLIRRQGLDVTEILVTSDNATMCACLSEFYAEERVRLKQVAEKKAKEEAGPTWSDAIPFLIPDIGTLVRIQEDWTFRLYNESRNDSLMEALGIDWRLPISSGGFHGRYSRRGGDVYEVTLRAGSLLRVDRIYIRQGGKERKRYSSVTFNLQKGGSGVYNGTEVLFKRKGARFWAKLSDVNRMRVQVDKGTLAEN